MFNYRRLSLGSLHHWSVIPRSCGVVVVIDKRVEKGFGYAPY